MSRLIFNNAALVNTDTFESCVKLTPSTNYIDTIYRNTLYTGQTPKTISIRNTCVTSYLLSARTLFTDIVGGGNFNAKVAATNIPANSTVNIPVAYTGTYKGTSNNPVYTISVNGTSATYTLTILTPDTAPTTEDVTLALGNREDAIINKTTLNYNDVDGIGTVTHVRFSGDVSRLFTDVSKTVQYVANTELPINTFNLYYKAPDQDGLNFYEATYNVKADGVWSI